MKVIRRDVAGGRVRLEQDLTKSVAGAGHHETALPVRQVADDGDQALGSVMQDDQKLVARGHGEHVVQIKIVVSEIDAQRIGRRQRHAILRNDGEVDRFHAHRVLTGHVVELASGSADLQAVNVQRRKIVSRVNQLRRVYPSWWVELKFEERGAGVLADKLRGIGICAVKNVLV